MFTVPWRDIFPQATLQTLVAPLSNHTPLLLQLEPAPRRTPHSCFRFNNSWLLESDLTHTVKNGWNLYPFNNSVTKLGYCIEDMKIWSKFNLPKFNQRKQRLCSHIEAFCFNSVDLENPHIIDLQRKLVALLLQ
jgi:hypothetical protein